MSESNTDEKKEATGGEETSTGDAKQTLKDLIHITQPDNNNNDGGDSEDFVDLDDDDDDSEKNPVLKTMDHITSSVRGNFEKHVAPKVDELVSNTQYLLDTHVAPKLKEAQANTDKAIKGAQEHTSRMVQDVQTHSSRAVQGVQEHSSRAVKGLQENTQKALESVDRSTKEFHSTHVAPKIEKSLRDMDEFHSKNVKPHVDKALQESKRAMDETGGCLSKSWTCASDYVIAKQPYYWNTAPDLFDNSAVTAWYLQLEEATCRAFARVAFCDNPVTGIFIFLGILVASPLAGLCSLTSVVMTNLTALYLDMDRTTLCHGWYAYNSVLVGTALVDYFSFANTTLLGGGWPVQVFLSILLAPMTLFLQLWLQHKVLSVETPVLLLPFNIIMFVVLLSAKVWDSTMITKVDIADEGMMDAIAGTASRYYGYQAVLNGIARIFLVDGVAAGALILIGICACSRILALAVVGGTFVASLLSLAVFDVPTAYLNAGFAGFNAALAMTGIFFYLVPSWKLTGLAFFWLILTMIATGAVDVLLDVIGIPVAMSFGFCFALLPLLSLDPSTVFGPNHTLIQRIPADELSCPEEYLEKTVVVVVPAKELDEEDVETGKAGEVEEIVEVQNETTPLLSST